MIPRYFRLFASVISLLGPIAAQKPANTLVVANDLSPLSRQIAEYYISKRGIPLANYCHLRTRADEEIDRAIYQTAIEDPVKRCLSGRQGAIAVVVLTQGVPLKIRGTVQDEASVDSELAVLPARTKGARIPIAGPAPNPYFRQRDAAFDPERFPMLLVARIAAQTRQDALRMIDDAVAVGRDASQARRGKVVIDQRGFDSTEGDEWLKSAAIAFPADRVVFDEGQKVVRGVSGVIGYAGWGSNDHARKDRKLGFRWLPGSIATEFVSSNVRTFEKPPDNWTLGDWKNTATYFAGTPQSLTSDTIAEGASAATGHVYEPYLNFCPRPELLLPAYLLKGRTLGEAYYQSIPALSWKNALIGDPLMALR